MNTEDNQKIIQSLLEDTIEALHKLGTNHADTNMGAIESATLALCNSAETITSALHRIADAVEEGNRL